MTLMSMFRFLIAVLCLASCAFGQSLPYAEYVEQLAEKVRFKDDKGIDRLLKNNTPHVLAEVRAHVRDLMKNPDDAEVTGALDILKQSWQRVYRTDTLDHLERWIRSLEHQDYTKYEVAVATLNRGINEFHTLKSKSSEDREKYEKLRDGFMELAEQLEYIGEKIQAATCWNLVAEVYGKMPNPTLIEKKDAVYAAQRFLDLRDAWAFDKDEHYILTANWIKHERERLEEEKAEHAKRLEEGYDEDITGIESYLTVDADANEKIVPLEFRILGKPNELDVSFQGGMTPIRWPSVEVLKKGPSEIRGFRATDLFLARPKGSRYIVTLDGTDTDFKQNKGEAVIAVSKIKKPSLFHLDADKTQKYAMWFYTPGSSEVFQGMSQNFEPVHDRAVIYYKSASSWVADVDGVPITFYDDNSDGKIMTQDFVEEVDLKLRAITNTPEEHAPIASYDGMRVGKKGKIVPFSQWVKVGDAWWHLRPQAEGQSIGLRPTNPEYFKTGKLKVAWKGFKGTKLDMLLVQGRGWFAEARFDIANGAVEVPAGDYVVKYGRVSQGKGARLIGADVLPGKMEMVHVKPGETTTLELGAPFHLDFNREGSGRDLKVDAKTIRVVGRGGEVYRRINGATPSPSVMAAKTEDGKGAKEIARFERISDVQLFGEVTAGTALGYELGYYPIVKGENTFVLEMFVDEGLLIGLKEDKNKLFGKLLPIYK